MFSLKRDSAFLTITTQHLKHFDTLCVNVFDFQNHNFPKGYINKQKKCRPLPSSALKQHTSGIYFRTNVKDQTQ